MLRSYQAVAHRCEPVGDGSPEFPHDCAQRALTW